MSGSDGVEERNDLLRCPISIRQIMLDRKMLGDKTGGGFYKKQKGSAEDERLGLDWKTLEYRPRQKARFASLDTAKNIDQTSVSVRILER